MTQLQGPNNRGKCPFYVIPDNPLSAEKSVHQCVSCVRGKSTQMYSHNEDLRQIAFLTIIEETPKYDPDHPSGASYTTFIKAKVCTRLWQERTKILREIPYSHQECQGQDSDDPNNPLLIGLFAQACVIENMADNVIQKIEVEFLRNNLPNLMNKLSENERQVIQMKFFDACKGKQIAEKLNITEGYVTRLTQSALAKLGKAYLNALDTENGNPYRNA
ncbi:MAG: sigma-70 family RNA polymerase sigma factor [Candidatus Poribacteria bacterium]|nr:sigma-70 family RNA polymerase sigma factor [Candidatus Poribacteria bacterium]